jgi:cellulose synthase/poly-beta-1,6-N-acetylglucosamine synthase-like glycosyltransferase
MSVWIFWVAIALVAYTYALYPALAAVLSRWMGRTPHTEAITPALAVVVAAHNEESRIATRVRDILEQEYPEDDLRVIVVDDGSTDGTAAAADIGDARVQVIRLPRNVGKAAALNAGVAAATAALVVFTDARQRFAPGALRRLAEPFADPEVGVVSGELAIAPDVAGRAADIGLYWRIETMLRESEARLGWLHGVSGAIHAMRRELIPTLPPGLILDDMYLPLTALFAGKWVWMTREAVALDSGSRDESEEFRRKLRTLAGNWQLLAKLPRLLNPFTNPVFFAFVSHKLLRLLAPWALIAALPASLCARQPFYAALFVLQLLAYAIAALAIFRPRAAARIPFAGTAGTFVMLNAAALCSLPACIVGPRRLWKKH